MRRGFRFQDLLRHGLQGAALGGAALGLALFITAGPDTLIRLKEIDGRYFLLPFLMVACAWLCNGARIALLCRAMGHALPYRSALAVSLSMEFGVAASPGGVGGVAVRLLFLRKAGIPLAQATAMLGADVMLDMLYFFLILPVALAVAWRDPAWRGLAHAIRQFPLNPVPALILLAGLLLGLLIWTRLRRRAADPGRHPLRRAWRRGRARLRPMRENLRQTRGGLGFLLRRRRGWLALDFLFAAVQWSCRYGILPLLLVMFGAERNPFPLLALQGLLLSLSMLVVLPGGGGALEFVMLAILPLFIPASSAGVVLLLWRFFTYHLNLLAGGMVFFWTVRRLRPIRPGVALPPETC